MTDTQRPWDRLTTESDPAYEAFAAYLEARWPPTRAPAWRTRLDDARTGALGRSRA